MFGTALSYVTLRLLGVGPDDPQLEAGRAWVSASRPRKIMVRPPAQPSPAQPSPAPAGSHSNCMTAAIGGANWQLGRSSPMRAQITTPTVLRACFSMGW